MYSFIFKLTPMFFGALFFDLWTGIQVSGSGDRMPVLFSCFITA